MLITGYKFTFHGNRRFAERSPCVRRLARRQEPDWSDERLAKRPDCGIEPAAGHGAATARPGSCSRRPTRQTLGRPADVLPLPLHPLALLSARPLVLLGSIPGGIFVEAGSPCAICRSFRNFILRLVHDVHSHAGIRLLEAVHARWGELVAFVEPDVFQRRHPGANRE
jgi:hypothetical protein